MKDETLALLLDVQGIGPEDAEALRRLSNVRSGLPLLQLYAEGRINADLLLQVMASESGIAPESADQIVEPAQEVLRRARWELLAPLGVFPIHADSERGLSVAAVDPLLIASLVLPEMELRLHLRLVAPAQLNRLYRIATGRRWRLTESALLSEDLRASATRAREELQRLYQRLLRTSGINERITSEGSGRLGGMHTSTLVRALDPLQSSGANPQVDEASSWSRSPIHATAPADELRPHEVFCGTLEACVAQLREGDRQMEVALRLAAECAKRSQSRHALAEELVETLGIAWPGVALLWVRGDNLRVGTVVTAGVRQIVLEGREVVTAEMDWWADLLRDHEAMVAMLNGGDPVRQVFGLAGRGECLAIAIRISGRAVALLLMDAAGGRVYAPSTGLPELVASAEEGLRRIIIRRRAVTG